MAIKFYLWQIDDQHEIHCNTNSSFTEIAGSFDAGTMELEWNECKNAIFPNTPFFIKETISNKVWSFIVAEDKVEIVRKESPQKYLHTLTITQSIHKLNDVPLRNTVFGQLITNYSFTKPTLFIGVAKYVYEGDNWYHRRSIEENIVVNHNFNTFNFNKIAYPFTINNAKYVRTASIKCSTIINSFSKISGVAGGQVSGYKGRTSAKRLTSLSLRFYNFDDNSDYMTINLSGNQIYDFYTFTQSQIDWLARVKKFVILIRNGTIDTDASHYNLDETLDPQYITGHGEDRYMPLLLGLLNIEFNIEFGNYTLWDVLDIINEQCRKEYNGQKLPAYYTMPSKTDGGQGELLANTLAPDFSFTNSDLYSAVAKVMTFIDAFPVLDENGVLGFQYLNDLSQNEIDPLLKADDKVVLNEKEFTNKLAVYIQNGKSLTPITFPAKNVYRLPNTTKFGIADRNDWYWTVDKPIDYIKKITILTTSASATTTTPYISGDKIGNLGDQDGYSFAYTGVRFSYSGISGKMDVDMTSVVVREEVYGTLPVGFGNSSDANQNNTLYYRKGDNKIYCGITGKVNNVSTESDVLHWAIRRAISYSYGFGGSLALTYNYTDWTSSVTEGSKTKVSFNCIYYAINDDKLSQESTINKTEKETPISQNETKAQINRLGNNLQGLIAKLGNDEHSVTMPITDLNEKIELGTKYIDDLGNTWIATRIKTDFTTSESKVIVSVTFSKNYNALAQFTTVNQDKRFFEISNQITTKGYENLNEFVYFTSKPKTSTELNDLATNIAFTANGWRAIFAKCFNATSQLNDYHSVFETARFASADNSGNILSRAYIFPKVYGAGNQICFELDYQEPLQAGISTTLDNENRRFGKASLYTDATGAADKVTIVCNFREKDSWVELSDSYPSQSGNLSGIEIFRINSYWYYKKPNEIFHVNYAINFMPYWTKVVDDLGTSLYRYEEIFFGDKFVNENGIIPNTDYENGKPRTFKLFVSDVKYSMLDNKVDADSIEVAGTITITGTLTTLEGGSTSLGYAHYGSLEVKVNGESYDLGTNKNWALTDEDGNIYIAVNREYDDEGNLLSNETPKLYLFSSRYRKI